MDNLLEKFKEELLQLLIQEFGGSATCEHSVTSHGQCWGNKWIIAIADDHLEINVRKKLFPDKYDPEITKSQKIYNISLNDPKCFKIIKTIIRK